MEGAIFDLDGTLIDSLYVWDILAYNYLRSLGYSPARDLVRDFQHMNLEESSDYMIEKFKIPMSRSDFIRGMEELLAYYYSQVFKEKRGAVAYVKKLYNQGVKLCIATSSQKNLALMVLERLGILHCFDFIQTESDCLLSKREEDFFKLALERLGTDLKRTWIYEDSYYSMICGKALGCKIVGIRDEYQLEDWDKIEDLVDIFVDDYIELEEILNEESFDHSRFRF